MQYNTIQYQSCSCVRCNLNPILSIVQCSYLCFHWSKYSQSCTEAKAKRQNACILMDRTIQKWKTVICDITFINKHEHENACILAYLAVPCGTRSRRWMIGNPTQIHEMAPKQTHAIQPHKVLCSTACSYNEYKWIEGRKEGGKEGRKGGLRDWWKSSIHHTEHPNIDINRHTHLSCRPIAILCDDLLNSRTTISNCINVHSVKSSNSM